MAKGFPPSLNQLPNRIPQFNEPVGYPMGISQEFEHSHQSQAVLVRRCITFVYTTNKSDKGRYLPAINEAGKLSCDSSEAIA